MATMVSNFILGMILPAFVAIFAPIMIALWIFEKKPMNMAAKEAFYVMLIFVGIMLVQFLISPMIPAIAIFIKSLCAFGVAVYVGLMAGLSYILFRLMQRRVVALTDNDLLYIVVAVIIAEMLLPMIGLGVAMMSLWG